MMNNKNIIFLTIFYFNSMLIGMENQKSNSSHSLTLVEKIPNYTNMQKTWSLQKTFHDHDNWISSVCIDPSEKLLVLVPCNNQAQIIDIESGEKLTHLDFNCEISSVCFDNSGKKFAMLSHNPKTCIFDIIKNKDKITCNKIDSFKHDGAITSIYFDHEANLLGIEPYSDREIRIKNLKTNRIVTSFNHNNWALVTAVSQSGKFLATGSGNNKARLFNMKEKIQLPSFELNSSVSALAFDPFEKFLAVASRDNKVHIFDLKTYAKIALFDHNNYIPSLCFGSSGNMLATGSFDSNVRIFTKNEDTTVTQQNSPNLANH
jgi:WD40 repeat protein